MDEKLHKNSDEIDFVYGFHVVNIEKLKTIMSRTPGFKHKCFSESEIALCESFKNPYNYYSGILAAKLAAIKAFANNCVGRFNFSDFFVSYSDKSPVLYFSGNVRDKKEEFGFDTTDLTIKHNSNEAISLVASYNSKNSVAQKVANKKFEDVDSQINASFKELKNTLNL